MWRVPEGWIPERTRMAGETRRALALAGSTRIRLPRSRVGRATGRPAAGPPPSPTTLPDRPGGGPSPSPSPRPPRPRPPPPPQRGGGAAHAQAGPPPPPARAARRARRGRWRHGAGMLRWGRARDGADSRSPRPPPRPAGRAERPDRSGDDEGPTM